MGTKIQPQKEIRNRDTKETWANMGTKIQPPMGPWFKCSKCWFMARKFKCISVLYSTKTNLARFARNVVKWYFLHFLHFLSGFQANTEHRCYILPLKMENIVYVSPSLQQKSSLVTALVFISTGKCPVLSTTTIDQTANVRLAHMFSQDWRISVLRTLVTPPVKSSLILLMQCMLPSAYYTSSLASIRIHTRASKCVKTRVTGHT